MPWKKCAKWPCAIPVIADVRGLGLLMGIELATFGADGSRQPAMAEAEKVMYEALNRGLNFKVTMGNILTLTPALTLTKEEMDLALQIVDDAIGFVENQNKNYASSPTA
jgi:4-aminobutyrate aminotransferase